MKLKFPEIVENSRILEGYLSSKPGDTQGAFKIRHPKTRQKFMIIVGNGLGWDHISVSTKKHCPTWDEIHWVKDLFFEPDEVVVQYHPAKKEYVNCHKFCLHLWRPQEQELPVPPKTMV